MKKQVRKREQVTCECPAYGFPHRIGGGNCTGSAWCSSYRAIDSSLCDSCNCSGSNVCDAVTGQESFKNGDCYPEELRSQWLKDKYGNLPKSEGEVYEIEYRRYHE